jgi:hypothetical protein
MSWPDTEVFNAFQEESDGQHESVGPWTDYERRRNEMGTSTYTLAAEIRCIITQISGAKDE